jgi:hypothetical protein
MIIFNELVLKDMHCMIEVLCPIFYYRRLSISCYCDMYRSIYVLFGDRPPTKNKIQYQETHKLKS